MQFSNSIDRTSDEGFNTLERSHGLRLVNKQDIFSNVKSIRPSDWLEKALTNKAPIAQNLGSERACITFIIADILAFIYRHISKREMGLYFERNLKVQAETLLTGRPDIIVCRAPQLSFNQGINFPLVLAIEAKRNVLTDHQFHHNLPQCMIELHAFRKLNEINNASVDFVYSALTDGDRWKFLKLGDDKNCLTDNRIYKRENELPTILGILVAMIEGSL